jgi:AP-1-like factor
MTSIRNPLGELVLTPQQQSLLFAALNSNKATGSPVNNGLTMSPSTFDGSPAVPNHGLPMTDSPLLDFDYDFNNADSSFDFSFDNGDGSRMIGDLPGAPSTARSESASDQDSPDKRSHPDDDDEENGAKRRESEDKVSKKPGRKPLTTEPTSVSLDIQSGISCCLLTRNVAEAEGPKQGCSACFSGAQREAPKGS